MQDEEALSPDEKVRALLDAQLVDKGAALASLMRHPEWSEFVAFLRELEVQVMSQGFDDKPENLPQYQGMRKALSLIRSSLAGVIYSATMEAEAEGNEEAYARMRGGR